MSISVSVNGHCQVPPGFRFQPTEEELLLYYLRKRVSCQKIDLDVISDVDLNKFEPWDIQEKCKIGSIPDQSDWYLFSHKDNKYPSGKRTNRATIAGFWKATGRDKVIYGNGGTTPIGLRKTLVFYNGRAPHGHRSDWLMHEYRLITTHEDAIKTEEEGWVVCHIFKRKKKNQKTLNSPSSNSSKSMGTESQMLDSYNYEGALEQIFVQPSISISSPVDNPSRPINHSGHQPNKVEMVKYIRPFITTDLVDVAADPSRWAAFDGLNDVASKHDDHTADQASSQLAVGLNYDSFNTDYFYCVNHHHLHPLQLPTVLGSIVIPSSLSSFTSDHILDTNYV